MGAVILSKSGEKYAQIKYIVYTQKQFKTTMWVDFDVRGKQGMDVFTGWSIIMDYIFWLETTV